MSQVINTNIMSLTAQRNLNSSQSALSTAMQRLSSGLRINSAKDDAAGLAISTRFTTQINGLNQAVRNANDGISLSQTTESALSELTNNLQRIRELSVQSANATNSDSDRQALDAEVQQRLAEVTRISTQTSFNGRHVLDGSFGNAAFQIGANVGETININLSQGTRADQIGQVATASTDISGALTPSFTGSEAGSTDWTTANGSGLGTVSYNGVSVDWSGYTDSTQGDAVSYLQDALGDGYAVTANGDGQTLDIASTDSSVTLGAGDFSLQVGDGSAVDITGTFTDAQGLADAINAKGVSGMSAYVDDAGKLQLSANDDLTIGGTKAGTGAGNLGFATTGSAIAVSGSLDGVNVNSVAGANDTISRVDAALKSVSSIRSDLGAIQNRFESTISNLQTISENLDASRSRIQDADFASETAAMSRAQILQQAGVSMLAQANSAPQTVLKLLG